MSVRSSETCVIKEGGMARPEHVLRRAHDESKARGGEPVVLHYAGIQLQVSSRTPLATLIEKHGHSLRKAQEKNRKELGGTHFAFEHL